MTMPSSEAPFGNLLVLDTNYSLEGLRERQNEQSVTCRDLDGFFGHVWSVHPFATLVTSDSWGPRHGGPDTYELAPRHTVIEGKVGRFDWPGSFFPFNFLASQAELLWKLRRLVKARDIRIIRAASPLYVGLFGWLLARLTGAKLVIRVGGNHDKFFETTGRPMEPRLMRSRRVEKAVERFVFSRADLIAGANKDNLDFALANGAPPERSTIFRYGNLIDERHYKPPETRKLDLAMFEALGIEPGKFLLYVGRLEPIKQADHVIEVLSMARAKGFDVTGVLAGEGSMRGELEALAEKRRVGEFVRFPGNVDQGRLAHLYPTTACIISPHTGRALSEAALAAAPVVAYDVDWQAEIIDDGVSGRIVPHGDLAAFGAALCDLLADRPAAKKMGEALRVRALKMLDREALNEHERQTYQKLLSG